MRPRKPITFLASAAVIPLTALTVAACGGGAAATASPPPAPPKTTATPPIQTATVRVANSRLGRILVDSNGHTLYLFRADTRTSSACSGACASAWPPLRTGATPAAAGGANSALVGTIARSDGARQVTYNGHPLYTFVKDSKPGDVNGQGLTAFGGSWFAVSPAGNQISSHPTAHRSASSSSHSAAPAPAPAPATQPAPPPATTPAPPPPPPPAAKPTPPAHNGIPQNNGGDGDSDNNGGPSDGDGNI